MIRTYRVSDFCFFLWVLFERFLLPIPMELAPPVSDVVPTVYSELYIVLFILKFILFYSFSLPYVRLVVHTWRN
jgi:hypothetical protein